MCPKPRSIIKKLRALVQKGVPEMVLWILLVVLPHSQGQVNTFYGDEFGTSLAGVPVGLYGSFRYGDRYRLSGAYAASIDGAKVGIYQKVSSRPKEKKVAPFSAAAVPNKLENTFVKFPIWIPSTFIAPSPASPLLFRPYRQLFGTAYSPPSAPVYRPFLSDSYYPRPAVVQPLKVTPAALTKPMFSVSSQFYQQSEPKVPLKVLPPLIPDRRVTQPGHRPSIRDPSVEVFPPAPLISSIIRANDSYNQPSETPLKIVSPLYLARPKGEAGRAYGKPVADRPLKISYVAKPIISVDEPYRGPAPKLISEGSYALPAVVRPSKRLDTAYRPPVLVQPTTRIAITKQPYLVTRKSTVAYYPTRGTDRGKPTPQVFIRETFPPVRAANAPRIFRIPDISGQRS